MQAMSCTRVIAPSHLPQLGSSLKLSLSDQPSVPIPGSHIARVSFSGFTGEQTMRDGIGQASGLRKLLQVSFIILTSDAHGEKLSVEYRSTPTVLAYLRSTSRHGGNRSRVSPTGESLT